MYPIQRKIYDISIKYEELVKLIELYEAEENKIENLQDYESVRVELIDPQNRDVITISRSYAEKFLDNPSPLFRPSYERLQVRSVAKHEWPSHQTSSGDEVQEKIGGDTN